ncbi:MAG TPA: hypothetical protein VEG63_07180 [Candidatus Acidoferrales bacterium]|nr:hypothetical protein [Candidatus Acidoferrales bacterium]
MKKSLALLIAILMCVPAGWAQSQWKQFGRPADSQEPPAQAPQNEPEMDDVGEIPDVVSIPAGTHIALTIVRAPQETQAHEGAKVYLRTRSAVRAEGGVVIPARSLVVGVLTTNPGVNTANPTLSIRLKTIVLPNDLRLPISGRVLGTVGGPKGPSAAAVGSNPMAALSGLTPEQIAMISGFALVGAEIGQAMSKTQKGSVVGSMIGGGVGLATMLAMSGSHVNLHVGSNVDSVLEEPLTMDPRSVR